MSNKNRYYYVCVCVYVCVRACVRVCVCHGVSKFARVCVSPVRESTIRTGISFFVLLLF